MKSFLYVQKIQIAGVGDLRFSPSRIVFLPFQKFRLEVPI